MKSSTSIAAFGLGLALSAGFALGVPSPQVEYIDGLAVDLASPDDTAATAFRAGALELGAAPGERVSARYLLPPPERPTTGNPAVADLLRRASNSMVSNDLSSAKMLLSEALLLEPRNPAAIQQMAVLTLQRREYQEAKNYFERYLDLAPDSLPHRTLLMVSLCRLYRFEELDRQLGLVRAANPQHFTLVFFGSLLQLLRHEDPDPLRQAARLQIEDVDLIARWLLEEAEFWTKLLDRDGYRRLCNLTLGSGSFDQLAVIIDRIGAVRDGNRRNDQAAVLSALNALHELGQRSFGILTMLAEAYRQAGQVDKAKEIWLSIVKRESDWPDMWLNYSLFLLQVRDPAESLVWLERTLRHSPGSPIARFLKACAQAAKGDVESAQPVLNELVRSRPREVRQWMEMDPAIWDAVKKLPNHTMLFRLMDIPPENE